MRTRALPIALAFAGIGLPAAAQDWTSSYTRHDYQRCRKDRASQDPVAVHRCAGKAGIEVVWTADDDSSSVAFGARPVDETIVEGAAFFEAGKTIEWRGPKGGRPLAAIVRYATGARIGKLDGSRLVVYRLAPQGGCIIGSVDGREPDANAAARRLADAKAAAFRCGRGQRGAE